MKIVGVRLKKGIHKPIKDTAKIYYFMCPIKNVGIGDYVLLECDGTDKINIFQVGLIIEEHDNTPENTELYMPFSFVVSGFPVKDFLARCDKVAEGIVKASQLIDLNVPIVVRLEGTNVEEGREILKNANVPGLIMAESMEQGAQKIVELVKNA